MELLLFLHSLPMIGKHNFEFVNLLHLPIIEETRSSNRFRNDQTHV
jgi:hypothetical protein